MDSFSRSIFSPPLFIFADCVPEEGQRINQLKHYGIIKKKKNKTKCPNSYRMLVSRPITRKQGVSWGKVPPLRPENHYSPLLMMWIKFSVNCHSRALGLKSPLSSKHWQQACLFCQIISFNFNLMLILEVIRSTVTWWRLEIICQNVTL